MSSDSGQALGAQTERWGDAGPAGGLLGSKDPAGRFVLRPYPLLRTAPPFT